MLYLASEFEFDESGVRNAIPSLVEEAHKRGITMAEFYQEFERATGIDNDGGRVPSDSDSETIRDEDEDGSSSPRNANGEGEAGDEESQSGEEV